MDEVEDNSESVSKKLNTLYDELESYKSQCKSLKQEMEDQVNFKNNPSMGQKNSEIAQIKFRPSSPIVIFRAGPCSSV